MSGYRQKWLPPPTIDDYMYEVQQNIWWGNRERATRQLIWIMEKRLGREQGSLEGDKDDT